MKPYNSLEKPEFSQEFRLGLVVYGGVSLAIYMNGVSREFYNAVRGRGVYKLLKALTDSDIIVDVISGTSAGGINGVLLSYALTNSSKERLVDFQNFAEIWRDSGNISKLLREPVRNKGETNSFLDGEHYYQKELEDAFRKASNNSTAAANDEWYSYSAELDLFVTGTDVLGKVYKVFDNTGKLIEVKDNRTVFVLKHREGREYPFQPEQNNQQALAKLCRITSCFPVAFPVVTVDLEPPINSPDEKIVEWGQLLNRELPQKDFTQNKKYQLHFVDGGVLDNRPFSYTIGEIYHRTAYRPVERRLFYIDPSPDQFLDSPNFKTMAKPSIWQATLDSLIGMPSYQSIAHDLEEINDRNEKVRRYKFLRGTAERDAEQRTDAAPAVTPESEQIYLRCRLVGLRDRLLPLVLRIDQVANPNNRNKQELLEKAAKLITQYVSDPTQQRLREDFLHKVGKEIRNLDVDYALRKHFFIQEKICQLMVATTNVEEHKGLKLLAQGLCQQLELLKVIRAAVEWMLKLEPVSETFYQLIDKASDKESARKEIYDYLLRLHRYLLDANDLPDVKPEPKQKNDFDPISANFFNQLNPPITIPQLKSVFAQLKQRAEQLTQPTSILQDKRYKFFEGTENDSKDYFSILRKVELASESLIESSHLACSQVILNQFKNFRKIDSDVYAYEYLADIQAREILKIIRISPNDAQRGFGKGKGTDDKLAGNQLYAFGGFFKKSWRSNDILWGRLDGLNRIVETLLTLDSLKNFSNFLTRQIKELDSISEQQYIKQLIVESLPNATAEENAAITGYLVKLAKPDTQLTKEELDDFLEQLVSAGHRAILNTDLSNVAEDAIAEQLEWNQQSVLSSKSFQKTLNHLNYKPIHLQFNKIEEQSNKEHLHALKQLNDLVTSLLNPRLLKGITTSLAQQATAQQSQIAAALSLAPSSVVSPKQYIEYLMRTSFYGLPESEYSPLIKYPVACATNSSVSVDELFEFLNRLSIVSRREKARNTNATVANVLEQMTQQFEQVLNKIKPKYQPISGYFDRAVTAFTAKELALTSMQSLSADEREEYFRNLYRVGSEKLATDIPSIVIKNLAARTGLIFRDILASPPTGALLRGNIVYEFVNKVLQLFYWSIQLRSPRSLQSYREPRLVSTLISLVLLIAVIAGIMYLISKLPFVVLVAITTLTVLYLLWALWKRVIRLLH